MGEEGICFKITFKPTLSWPDKTYFGNMLTEVLGLMVKNTSAFEFSVEEIPNKENNNHN